MIKYGAVSIAGVNNSGAPKLNQDAASCITLTNGAIAIISDGAGSAAYSNIGSQLIVRQFCKSYARRNIPLSLKEFDDVVRSIIKKIRRQLVRLSSMYALQAKLEDFHATLLFAAISGDRCFIAHLGDGACMLFNQNHEIMSISLPENGEYANQTHFITEENWVKHLRCREISGNVHSCLIMSDGVTPLALKGETNFPQFTTPLLTFLGSSEPAEAVKTLSETLRSDTVMKISSDDKSLAWWLRC